MTHTSRHRLHLAQTILRWLTATRVASVPNLLIAAVFVTAVFVAASAVAGDAPTVDGFTAPYHIITIGAPESGVIENIAVTEGTQVQKGDLLVLVQLNPLMAEFAVPRHLAEKLRQGNTVAVAFADSVPAADATIEYVAPVTDAESGTVKIKVRIENPTGAYRSGERCRLQFDK